MQHEGYYFSRQPQPTNLPNTMTRTQMIAEIAAAANAKSEEALSDLRSINDEWLQTEESRRAIDDLIYAIQNLIAQVEDFN